MKKKLISVLSIILVLAAVFSLGPAAFAATPAGITVVTTPEPAPTIKKHPTGESITEGRGASFVAKASNVTSYVWHCVSADGKDMTIPEAKTKYGVEFTGDGTEKLTVTNTNASISGASVYCEFKNSGGSVSSNKAVIVILDQKTGKEVVATPAPDAVPEGITIVETPAPEIVEEHNHVFTGEWSHDSNYHWHECECGEKQNKEPHEVEKWSKSKEDKTLEEGKCIVCGATLTRTAEKKSGSFLKTLLIILLCVALIGGGLFFADRKGFINIRELLNKTKSVATPKSTYKPKH